MAAKPVTSAAVLKGRLRATLRAVALVAGVTAVGVLGVAGCSGVTGGTATVDAKDAPEYRTSVSVSASEASVTSAERESERQASLTTQAVHTVCETLSTSSADAVKNVNAYVDAVNSGGDVAGTMGPAMDALNGSADQVSTEISDALPSQLHDALTAWVDASRAAGAVLAAKGGAEQFNSAVDQVNTARSHALDLCDQSY